MKPGSTGMYRSVACTVACTIACQCYGSPTSTKPRASGCHGQGCASSALRVVGVARRWRAAKKAATRDGIRQQKRRRHAMAFEAKTRQPAEQEGSGKGEGGPRTHSPTTHYGSRTSTGTTP
eukprot:3160066-Rhodomonas_salina.2